MLLDAWKGIEPADTYYPEEWIASTTKAINADSDIPGEGLTYLDRPEENNRITLTEWIKNQPETILGKRHVERYGFHTGVLIKMIDSAERLSIQVHPDKEFAKALFNSLFGKTEAWYILGGRTINGEEPYVLIGFKPGMDRGKWKDLQIRQDIDGMIGSLHKIPALPGQVFLIEGGVPHAIGPGCFLVEIQEPTDLTLRVETTDAQGRGIPPMLCHQGIGFEKMLDCFHYDCYTEDELLTKWQIESREIIESSQLKKRILIDKNTTRCFSMELLSINGTAPVIAIDFSVIIVLQGSGNLKWKAGLTEIKRGESFFLLYNGGELLFTSAESKELQILKCGPPT
jgi:mannose-6-phosphate isomerase